MWWGMAYQLECTLAHLMWWGGQGVSTNACAACTRQACATRCACGTVRHGLCCAVVQLLRCFDGPPAPAVRLGRGFSTPLPPSCVSAFAQQAATRARASCSRCCSIGPGIVQGVRCGVVGPPRPLAPYCAVCGSCPCGPAHTAPPLRAPGLCGDWATRNQSCDH
jgi:hypothetical protein